MLRGFDLSLNSSKIVCVAIDSHSFSTSHQSRYTNYTYPSFLFNSYRYHLVKRYQKLILIRHYYFLIFWRSAHCLSTPGLSHSYIFILPSPSSAFFSFSFVSQFSASADFPVMGNSLNVCSRIAREREKKELYNCKSEKFLCVEEFAVSSFNVDLSLRVLIDAKFER